MVFLAVKRAVSSSLGDQPPLSKKPKMGTSVWYVYSNAEYFDSVSPFNTYDTEKAEFLTRVKFCILAWHEVYSFSQKRIYVSSLLLKIIN